MPNPFIRRLEHGADLTDEDRAALAHLTRHARRVAPRAQVFTEEDPVTHLYVVLEGWACRWKMLDGGSRQITDLMLPGDACHPHARLVPADHGLSTLSACTVAEIDPGELATVMDSRPAARCALRWATLQTDSILRETVTNNGRRQAAQRIAHLVCEVMARLRAASALGRADPAQGFPWLLTQEELADVTSLTSVHINRSFRALRVAGLMLPGHHVMCVPDAARLAAFCGFRSDYLHLAKRSPAGPARST